MYRVKRRKYFSGRKIFIIAWLELRQDRVAQVAVKNEQLEQMALGYGNFCTSCTRHFLRQSLRLRVVAGRERRPQLTF